MFPDPPTFSKTPNFSSPSSLILYTSDLKLETMGGGGVFCTAQRILYYSLPIIPTILKIVLVSLSDGNILYDGPTRVPLHMLGEGYKTFSFLTWMCMVLLTFLREITVHILMFELPTMKLKLLQILLLHSLTEHASKSLSYTSAD